MVFISSQLLCSYHRRHHHHQQQHLPLKRWTIIVQQCRCFILLLLLLEFSWKIAGNLTTAPEERECPELECLKCNAAGCIKCQNFIKYDDRQCVSVCPRGYMEQWSSVPDLMGRICRANGYSDPMIATIIGSSIGSVICILVLIFGMILIKKKHRQKHDRHNTIVEESVDRDEFVKQLDELRPNAPYFLAMLNDTRCRIRKLYLSGDHVTSHSQRAIVHDLAKLLILLNKPVQLITNPPQDWNRLYIWALRILERCKPEIAQLIDFLQAPAVTELTTTTDCRLASSQYSTFKSTNTMATAISNCSDSKNLQQMELFGSLISLHEFEEPRSSNLLPRNSCSTLKSNYSSTDIHSSSLWLEDEFFKLGLRPQDEITTEL